MKNWSGINNLQNIKNETLIVWGDKDTSYNFDQVDTLNNILRIVGWKFLKIVVIMFI